MRRIRPFIRKAELFGQTETTLFPTLPNHLYADIFIDSQATIAAIKEKPLSERRRIRSSGRAWKTFIRNGMKGKTQQVQIHHIKAHEGVESLSQRGNDTADKMAKEYITKGEEMKAIPYFTSYEEEIVLFHESTLIEGDIRAWLKKHEVDKALELEGAQSVWPADQEIPQANPHSSKGNMEIVHSFHGWSGLDLLHLCSMPSATD